MENSFTPLSEVILPFDSAPFRGRFDSADNATPHTVREYFYYTGFTGPTGKPHGIEFTISDSSGCYKSTHSHSENPAFHLLRGHTYYFKIHSPGHPFWISHHRHHPPKPYHRAINNGTDNGTIEVNIPMDFTEDLYYICGLHESMSGAIFITDYGPTGPTGPSDGPTGPIGPTGPSDGPTGPTGPPGDTPLVPGRVYLNVYNQSVQTISDGSSVIFDSNGYCCGEYCHHIENQASIYVWKTGVYSLSTQIYSLNGCQFSIKKNDSVIPGATMGTLTGSTLNSMSVFCEITDADIIPYAGVPTGFACKFELVNTGGISSPVLLYDASSIGFGLPQSNASFLLVSL